VYLNGKLLGNHPFAYTGFSYDLTGLVHTDGHRGRDRGSARRPQPSSRWYSRDGIFRNVYLVTPGRSTWRGTAPSDHARPARPVSSGYATGPGGHRRHQRRVCRGDGGGGGDLHHCRRGRPPGGAAPTVSVPGRQTQTATVNLKVTSPALWSTDHPQLYTARTDLSGGRRRRRHRQHAVRIRSFTFDPAAGSRSMASP